MGNGIVYCSRYLDHDAALERLLGNIDGRTIVEPNRLRFETGKLYRLVLRNVSSDPHYFTSDEFAARIFTRFARGPGSEGLGLGLYLARAVFESVGGAMHIDTAAGKGTRVTVTVPVDVEARARRATGAPPRPAGKPVR